MVCFTSIWGGLPGIRFWMYVINALICSHLIHRFKTTAWTQRKCIIIPNIDVDRKSTLEKASPEMLTPNCCYSAACPQLQLFVGPHSNHSGLKKSKQNPLILPCGGLSVNFCSYYWTFQCCGWMDPYIAAGYKQRWKWEVKI